MKTIALLIGLSFLGTATCVSQNSEHHFTDAELIRLANHIKSLEAQNNLFPIVLNFTALNPVGQNRKTHISSERDRKGVYTDSEIIKLANYIKSLENGLKNTIIAEEQYKKALVEVKK
jgi:hypothetical protein